MAQVLVITPNPLLDCLHDGEMSPGVVTRSTGLNIVAGGKGLNVGRVLTAHGHEVIASGFAGGWTGDAFREIVRAEGQADHFVKCEARLRLGFLARDCAGAGSTALLENGFAVSKSEQAQLLQIIKPFLSTVELCIISGSIPDNSCTDLFTEICGLCQQHSVPCWVDSYGPAMDAVLRSEHVPDYAKPNKQEFETSAAWQQLPECHITDGEHATIIHHQDGHFVVTPPVVTCVNPIGSGDSYIGALAHARLSAWPLAEQLAYAASAGAVNASQMAVANMSPDDIQALSKQVTITPQTSH